MSNRICAGDGCWLDTVTPHSRYCQEHKDIAAARKYLRANDGHPGRCTFSNCPYPRVAFSPYCKADQYRLRAVTNE